MVIFQFYKEWTHQDFDHTMCSKTVENLDQFINSLTNDIYKLFTGGIILKKKKKVIGFSHSSYNVGFHIL